MAEFKLVIGNPKTGRCVQRVVKDAEAKPFLGKMLGEKIKGDKFGLSGYEFEITGGSDHCGFPMRKDAIGPTRKRILASRGIGIKKVRVGQRVRKTVAGNTIHAKTSQINLKVLTAGKANLEAATAAESKEEKKEQPKEEKKAEKKEESKEDKKEPAKEDKKPEPEEA